jgi:hypothetical protein
MTGLEAGPEGGCDAAQVGPWLAGPRTSPRILLKHGTVHKINARLKDRALNYFKVLVK